MWSFTAEEARLAFNEAVESQGIEGQPSLYVLRHSGASDDLLSCRRSLTEIKARGRWVTDSSLRRYAKATKLQQNLNQLDAAVIAFGNAIDAQLVSLVEDASVGRAWRMPLPVVARAVTRARTSAPSMTTRWLPSSTASLGGP